jgi:hypothetical protein
MFQDPETFANRSVKGPDQMMLQKYVWKTWGKWSSVQHGKYILSSYLNDKFEQLSFLHTIIQFADSYFCETFPGSIGKKFSLDLS